MARPSPVTSPARPDDGAPQDAPDVRAERPMPPRTPYEDAIVGILGDVLGCSDIDVRDGLLALGDVSLVPRVVAQIRRTMGVDIPVADYIESRTVAGLAAAVAAKSFTARSASRPRALGLRPADAAPVLSFDQQRLWMENQLLPGVIYNVHGRRRIVGTLDVATFEASIRAIIARHETLRTTFPTVDGDPVQVVHDPDDNWRIRIDDLSAFGADGADDHLEQVARRLLDEEATTPFDLATGPLIRCLLIRLSDAEHVLGVTMHHIVSDAWSIGLFVRELSALYRAGGDPQRAGLSPLSVQYRDYAVWQRGWLVGDTLEYQVSHWRRHLAGAPPVLALPTAHRRSTSQGAAADRILAELSMEETAALHELCRAHGVTSFMVLYAVLATIFSRWSGQTDIVIGVPIAGRTDSATDKLIGFFVNVLPLRIDLSGNPAFADLLERVRRVALDGYAHAEAPIDVLVRDLKIARDPRRTPLFEVVLNVVASPEAEEVTGLAVEPMDTPSLFSRFDMSLTAQESQGALRLKLDFAADRCDATMGQVLLEQLRTMLRAAAADPTVRLLDEPVEEPATASASIVEVYHPAPHLAAERYAAEHDLVALVDGGGEWSYRWLRLAADRVAEILARSGVTSADRVGVVRRASAAFVAALVGCAKAAATCTVVETDDPSLTGPLGLSTVLDVSPSGEPAVGTIDLRVLLPDAAEAAGAPANPVAAGSAHDDWAVERFGLGHDDRFAVLSSLPGHLTSAVCSAFGAGATLVIPDRSFAGDVGALSAWLRDNSITVAYVDPPILRAMSAQTPTPRMPTLRCVFVDNSGELLPHDVEGVRAMAPGCRCVGVYRVSETGLPLAAYEVPAEWDVRTSPLRVPLGTPLPGVAAALRRPSGQAAAIGELAEIWDGTDRTGDLARRWSDGSLEYVCKVGANPGFDPIETVATLRDVADVRDAVVTGHVAADGSTTLLGYLAGPDPKLGTIAIHNHLVARLPEYLVPRQLFVLDALPRTPWGGYDLRSLPRPDADAAGRDEYVSPRTPMERQLTEILEELLDIERVGIYDSFFELGGFSMLATQLVTRVREIFGVQLAIRDVFESPTVDELAQLVVRAQGELSGLDDLEALLAEIEQTEPADTLGPSAGDLSRPGAYERAVASLRESAAFGPDKPDETPESSARALCWAAAGAPRSAASADEAPPELTSEQEATLDVMLARRIAGEPLAYLTGLGSFLGLELLTEPGALIPRKETELLGRAVLGLVTELAGGLTDAGSMVHVLDMCTGAGNLAVSLAVLERRARVWAADLEADAVAVAERNVALHGVAGRVTVVQGDLFGALDQISPSPRPFDLVVCNPPYMPSEKANNLPAEIGGSEPVAAFDGGAVGLSVIYRFIAEAPKHVVPGGWVCFELGAGMGRVVEKRLAAHGTYGEIRTLTDGTGTVRAILARTLP